MAELEFIFSEQEQVKLMDFLVDTGAGFVPCIGYEDATYNVISRGSIALDTWKKANETGPVGPVFVVWPNITVCSLEYDCIEKRGKKLYYPAQGQGGPYMDYLPCETTTKNEKILLSNGLVGYHQNYWIAGMQESIPVPDVMKKMYKQIIKYIRSMSTRLTTEPPRRSYWVGHEALQMLREGATSNAAGLIIHEEKKINCS